MVAPHRAQLASGPRESRLALLDRFWEDLMAESWEELCRARLPAASRRSAIGRLGRWGPASRWWKGNSPEWDLVSASQDDSRLLLGDVKWSPRPFTPGALRREAERVAAREPPALPRRWAGAEIVRALFVPDHRGEPRSAAVRIVRAVDLL